jgi:SHS2 domain-containing protein
MRWEHFEHGADVGVRGIGATPSEAFAGAAAALCALVSGDPSRVRAELEEEVACDAPDLESLLVRFLNELIYRMSAHRMVYGGFTAAVTAAPDGYRVAARVAGEPLDLDRHEPTVEPKGATFMLARVAREGDGPWISQCVVDV